MSEEEPRLTKAEWQRKESDDRVVERVRYSLTGCRISSLDILLKMMEIVYSSAEPSVMKEYGEWVEQKYK